ncbi:Txe/YoeB family addiction module toxin [Bifidobacterium pseudocatenulatum]|uniref:Txe/YoeB family addiction module toxin n=1 Tax=Bifidobacterium pseudocatenulatum TaxID=28026 RepID=UPI0022DFAB0D|nr:Txe/YoeB family addiction module toxin [Bifidobacterium pseudocatenulatum]
MNHLQWTDDAWDDYLCRQSQNRRAPKQINTPIRNTLQSSFGGIGKPGPLNRGLQGAWNRRIDSANRLIYMLDDDDLCILSIKDHYGDRRIRSQPRKPSSGLFATYRTHQPEYKPRNRNAHTRAGGERAPK